MSDLNYLFNRRHPQVQRHTSRWQRAEAAYSGGAAYIAMALIRHVSESLPEFDERKNRAYYFNYPRKIARVISQFVLSESPQRTNADAELVEDFNRTGLRTDEVMLQASTMLNCFGSAWLLVDMPGFDGEMDMERKQRERIRPYTQALKPWQVRDWNYGGDGRLEWAIIEEHSVSNSDPLSAPVHITRCRLWTRTDWKLYEKSDVTGLTLKEEGKHSLGGVPLIRIEEPDGFGMHANHWFEDVVRVSDAILNAESEAQMNIIKQMFGLLVVSESFRNAGLEPSPTVDGTTEPFSHVLARSAALWETTEEKGISRYIAPSGAETAVIRSEIQNLKKELFDVVGLAVQKDSKEAQTAESKAWDNQNVQQFLASRASLLEQAERQAWEMMNRWDPTVTVPEVSYNREFSVIDLSSAVEALLNLKSLPAEASTELQREIMRGGVQLLEKVKKIPAKTKELIEKEIDQYVPQSLPVPEMEGSGLGEG